MRSLEACGHRTFPLWILCLAVPLFLVDIQARAQTTGEKVAAVAKTPAEPAPQIATLQIVAENAPPVASSSAMASPAPQRLSSNPKLVEASCTGLHVASGAPGVLVFDDSFESGGPGAWQESADSFSPRGALDLEFSAELQNFSGEALLRVELTSPTGHGYQTLEAPVITAAAGTANPGASKRIVDGYPHPMTVRFAAPAEAAGTQSVAMTWPLAGTHVVNHGLYGEWTVAASLVDITSPTGAIVTCPGATFTLRP